MALEVRQAVIEYVEKHSRVQLGEKVFAYGEFIGMRRMGNRAQVYGFISTHGYLMDKDQVLEGGAGNWFGIYHAEFTNGTAIVDSSHIPVKSWDPRTNLPEQIYERCMAGPGQRIVLGRKYCRERIIAHFTPLMDPNRSFEKPRPGLLGDWSPWKRKDSHGHKDDIYNFRNLRQPYEHAEFVALSDSVGAKLLKAGQGSVRYSPDRRFEVLAVMAPETFFLIHDVKKKEFLAYTGLVSWWTDKVEWLNNSTLVFDQINGLDRFVGSQAGVLEHYGVHFEIELGARRVLWAVPFGFLGFAEKRAGK